MTVDDKEIQRRVGVFMQTCRETGARVTPQRLEVFREIAASEEHPHAEMIFRHVRKRLPTISLDTVYRTLWWLSDLGLVSILGPVSERARFDANRNRHHHFVCVRCGLTRDFYSDALDRLELPDPVAEIGSITRTQVEVKGECHACRTKHCAASYNN